MFEKIVAEVMSVNPDFDQYWVEGAVLALYSNLGHCADQSAQMAETGEWGASLTSFEHWRETGDEVTASQIFSLFEAACADSLMGKLGWRTNYVRTDEHVRLGAARLGLLRNKEEEEATEWWQIEQSVLAGHRII